ncbi:type VI secretion system tip protein TssI/VgrG [Sorangium sp. So ce1014]|uniref:type VI secretion system Vgr family protein n=1 Tax=Sorangium sp. So ce1014 TaxID=3133326 RepID=UPI003F6391C4
MAATFATFSLEGDKIPADTAVTGFEAIEAVSTPYTVEVRFATMDAAFRVEDCLRSRLCLRVVDTAGNERLFDGIVDRAGFARIVGEARQFDVRLRPALAALAHREGCRIFQEKSVVQVVQTVLEEAGFGDKVEWRNAKEYEPREFIVQYRESHLNFVSRLLEDNGLFYYFRHEADGHTMIITDDPASFAVEEGTPVLFRMAQGGLPGSLPLAKLTRTRALRTNRVVLRDYDFEKPDVKPESSLPRKEALDLPYFEYPAGFTKGSVGARRADARMRELSADADVCEGESRASGLKVGEPFLVEGAAEPCLNGEFVVTHLRSRGNQTLTGGETNVDVENHFRGVPKGAPFAAERRARRPRIRGIQTAVVTGSSTQEQAIHVDKYGRIKVRFFWDRQGQQDHTASCWLRVSQVAMGGSMVLPRVGWEVSVAFLDGDPDRPLALGRTYNAEKTPPAALPAAKASGTLKSMSSPGAGGHNEIGMSDSSGSQGFGVHAQKDLNVTVKNDKVDEVAVNEEQHISVNGSRSVKVDESISVAGDQSLDVGAVLSHKITGNQSISIGGNDTTNAISNYVEKITGNRAYTVSGNQITISNGIEQSITGDMSRKVGALQLSGSLASINDNVLGGMTETVGAVKVQLINGSHGEQISANKDQTSIAAELHLTKGSLSHVAAGVTNLVGGLHYQKLNGDLVVQAPLITLLGAVGSFKGGGSELKLGGGPIVIKGTKIAVKGALVVKMGASMKLGS